MNKSGWGGVPYQFKCYSIKAGKLKIPEYEHYPYFRKMNILPYIVFKVGYFATLFKFYNMSDLRQRDLFMAIQLSMILLEK